MNTPALQSPTTPHSTQETFNDQHNLFEFIITLLTVHEYQGYLGCIIHGA